MFSNFFFSENHAVYEIMSKNVVEPEATNDVTIWRIRVACWISRSTSIHARAHAHAPILTHAHTTTYVILIAFLLQQGFENAS